ncbi:MAG: (d)CMP kinase [FCB group bacterium]|nr:(d)CMP kinase [FCB group bacterium]
MAVPIKLTALKGKIIAIDGPAGSGKSTTAKLLAERLDFTYLDTGAMYRAVALFALRNGVSVNDANAMEQIAAKVKIEFKNDGVIGQLIYLNGENVTEGIRTAEATHGSSAVAVHGGVRRELVKRQQEMGKKGSIVAEGRDTTSVVFPRADLKIYLKADLDARARRRFLEQTHKGENTTVEEQKKLLTARDQNDSQRKESPLTQVSDAIVVDTSSLTIEGQVEMIIKHALKAFKRG